MTYRRYIEFCKGRNWLRHFLTYSTSHWVRMPQTRDVLVWVRVYHYLVGPHSFNIQMNCAFCDKSFKFGALLGEHILRRFWDWDTPKFPPITPLGGKSPSQIPPSRNIVWLTWNSVCMLCTPLLYECFFQFSRKSPQFDPQASPQKFKFSKFSPIVLKLGMYVLWHITRGWVQQ